MQTTDLIIKSRLTPRFTIVCYFIFMTLITLYQYSFTKYFFYVDESHTDNATAQVYLVTSKHTVNFKFENKLEVVQNETSAVSKRFE